ncbi:MAG TPA: hypothetical protein VG817_02780 [Gemmatimonadales bacterium]|nr:hypothetical protein [Gemmatimonadales bacterium]
MRTLLLLTVLALPLQAQAPLDRKEVDRRVAAHQADFDYLLGEWQFSSVSQQWGPGGGVWTAVKLEGGQVLDEYRVLGDSGQTWYVTHTLRAYNAVKDQWDMMGLEYGAGLASSGSARRVGNEVHIEQQFVNPSGPTGILRITYYDITPDSFRWKADRSIDGGKTWVTKWLTIEATRTGPPRAFAPLASARKPS